MNGIYLPFQLTISQTGLVKQNDIPIASFLLRK